MMGDLRAVITLSEMKGGLPPTPKIPPGSIYASSGTASLVACVTGNKILGRQPRSHVAHRLDGDSV